MDFRMDQREERWCAARRRWVAVFGVALSPCPGYWRRREGGKAVCRRVTGEERQHPDVLHVEMQGSASLLVNSKLMWWGLHGWPF